MQVNVGQAKSQLSRLLELVEEGETVVITRHGRPVAELAPARRKAGFPFGIAREEPIAPTGDDWWQPSATPRPKTGSRAGKGLTDTHALIWAVRTRSARRIALHRERRQSMGAGSQVEQAGRADRRPASLVGKYVVRARIPALAEGLTLATKDAVLARYGAPVVWDYELASDQRPAAACYPE